MPTLLVVSIALLLTVAVLCTSAPVRRRLDAKILVGVVGLGAVFMAAYSLGSQAGRDAALRDNRADARAAAEAAKL